MAVGSNANFQIGEELSNTGTGKVNPNGKGLMPSANVNSSYAPGTKAFDEQQRVNNNALQAPATRAGGVVQTGLSGNNTGAATGSINFNAGAGAPKASNPGTTVAGGNFSTNGGKSGADIGTSTFTPLKANGTLATTPAFSGGVKNPTTTNPPTPTTSPTATTLASTTSSSSTGLSTTTTDGTSPMGTNSTPSTSGATSTAQTGTSTNASTTGSTPSSTSTTGSSTASGGTQGGATGAGTPEVYTPDNLDPPMKAQYNLMNPEQQKAFIAAGVNGAAAQIQYLAQAKEAKDNLIANYNAQQQMNANKNLAQNALDAVSITNAQTKLTNLHESLSYLGAGQPGKAATTALSVSQSLTQAATSLSAMQYAENLTQTNQGIAKQLDSTNFAYKIGQLQDSINQNVDQAIQGALSQASRADIRGLLDSPEKVEAFGSTLLADVDQRVGGMMSASTQQMDYLVQANNAFTQQMQTTFKNSQTVNTDMSGLLGHAVDMNGNPMIDASTGAVIPFAKTPPLSPYLDPATGQLVQYSLNADGTIKAAVSQILQGTNSQKDPWKQATDGTFYRTDQNGNLQTQIPGVSDPGTSDLSTIDLSTQASSYPNDAGVANNNPAGITYNDKFAQTLTDNGIQFTQGGNRGPGEGGSYFKFPNLAEGMKAYNLLRSSPTYQDKTVQQALDTWGTGNIAGLTTDQKNMTVTQLQTSDPQAFQQLQLSQIKKESPGVYKAISSNNITTKLAAQGQQYADDYQKIVGSGLAKPADIAMLQQNPALMLTLSDIANGNKSLTDLGSGLGGFKDKEQISLLASIINPKFNRLDSLENSIETEMYKPNTVGNTVNQINVVLDHLNQMMGDMTALQNGDVTAWNSLTNNVNSEIGDSNITESNTLASLIGPEVAKLIVGKNNLSQEEINTATNAFNAKMSAGQQSGTISTILGALNARGKNIRAQLDNQNGNDYNFVNDDNMNIIQQNGWDKLLAGSLPKTSDQNGNSITTASGSASGLDGSTAESNDQYQEGIYKDTNGNQRTYQGGVRTKQ